jgi:hypothetical protein
VKNTGTAGISLNGVIEASTKCSKVGNDGILSKIYELTLVYLGFTCR